MTSLSKIGRGLVAFLLSFTFLVGSNNKALAQDEYVDMDVFYNELAPHGNWYDDPDYGYVWQPRGIQNFQPYYTNGYWVMTEYGNTWVSNYNWGWAPFHYGRWQMSQIGWVWIPGNQWGPAWVDWRHGNGYYGWAPMGPGINININIGRWNTPADWFVFIPQGNIYNRGFYGYNRPQNYMNIYNNTIIVNNYYNDRNNRPVYNYGPRRDDIRRYTNRDIPTYNVTNAQTRGAVSGPRGNNLAVYRPEVRQNATAAPRNARNFDGTVSTRANNTNNARGMRSSETRTTARPATQTNNRSSHVAAPARNENTIGTRAQNNSRVQQAEPPRQATPMRQQQTQRVQQAEQTRQSAPRVQQTQAAPQVQPVRQNNSMRQQQTQRVQQAEQTRQSAPRVQQMQAAPQVQPVRQNNSVRQQQQQMQRAPQAQPARQSAPRMQQSAPARTAPSQVQSRGNAPQRSAAPATQRGPSSSREVGGGARR